MQQQSSDEEQEESFDDEEGMEDEEMDDDEEGEDDMEGGEDEMEDDEVDSDEAGSDLEEGEDELEEEEEQMESGESEVEDKPKKTNGALKTANKLGKAQMDDLDVALNQLKQEEKEESKFIQKRLSSEVQKAKSVRTQKKLFDNFLHQRILMQKLLQHANKLPSSKEILDKFVARSPASEMNLLSCKRNLKGYLKQQVKLQKMLFKLSETSVTISELPEFKSKATASTRDNSDAEKEEDKKLTANEIFKTVDANFKEMLPFVEETVDRWNSRTMIIKSLQSGSGAKGK